MDEKPGLLPDLNRLSILVGTILLAYSLTQLVSIPAQEFEFAFLGILFPIKVNFSTLVSLVAAGLTASGTAWLLETHPHTRILPTTAVHWLLPSLTSLVLLLAIDQLPLGGTWWLAVGASGAVLTLVLVAEYTIIDPRNRFYLLAEMLLTAIAIVLFLILAIALHVTETRLFTRIPVLSLAALLVYLRVIHLRQEGYWAVAQGAVAFLLIGELAAGLHYWPMGSIGFGIALTGTLYALIEVSDRISGKDTPLGWDELALPLLILSLSWIGAALV